MEIIRGIFESGRIPHAMLFSGPEGVGKKKAALLFAQTLVCADAKSRPCFDCEPCRKVMNNTFPDVILIGVREGSSRILIEQVREIGEVLAYRPFFGETRIIIIDPADLLTDHAAAAILKTLEEPPRGAHFILITARSSSLPATILSRCQKVRFSPLSIETIVEIIGRSDEAEEAAEISCGSVTVAQSLISRGLLDFRKNFIKALSETKLNDPSLFEALYAGMTKFRVEIPVVLVILKMWYRDLIVYRETGAVEELMDRELIMKHQINWEGATTASLIASYETVSDLDRTMMSRVNVNARIAFLYLCIRLAELKNNL